MSNSEYISIKLTNSSEAKAHSLAATLGGLLSAIGAKAEISVGVKQEEKVVDLEKAEVAEAFATTMMKVFRFEEGMTTDELFERYDGTEHPVLHREFWLSEVNEAGLTLGYWDWVEKCIGEAIGILEGDCCEHCQDKCEEAEKEAA